MNISLLAPAGLFAAVSLGIVLLLHIRRQTPPPRTFPSLRFWTKSESTETDRQQIRRPPITLPLILQLLLAAIVTLALARPAMSGAIGSLGGRTTPLHQIVLLDGSTSMMSHAPDEQRTRFDRGRQDVLSMLGEWQSGDVVTVLLLGTNSQTRSASNRQQVGELRDWLNKAPQPGGQADLNEALRLASNLGLADRENRITVVTDAALQADPEIAAAVGIPVSLKEVTGGEPSDNVAITSFTAKPIVGTQSQYAVTLTISNFTAAEADVPWYVEADGAEIAANTAFLRAGESAQVTVNLPVNAIEARATIDVRDALYADNRAMLPLEADRLGQLDILMISDAPSNLLRALQVLPGARVDLQPASIPGIRDMAQAYDLVVFEGTAPASADLPETPTLFVQPLAVPDLFTVTGSAVSPTLSSVSSGDPLLEGVDLSGVVFGDTPIYQPLASDEVLAIGSDGVNQVPLIWKGTRDTYPYVTLAFSVAASNIGQRVAFPILIASIVNTLTTNPIPMSVPIGDPVEVATAQDVAELEVTLPNQSTQRIPVQADLQAQEAGSIPAIVDFTGMSGRYVVKSLRADGSVASEGSFVVNAGHPQESNLTPNPNLESILETGQGSQATSAAAESNTSELWWALSLFAFAVMLIEWLVSGRAVRRQPLTATGARS
jgi:hypothetical protein